MRTISLLLVAASLAVPATAHASRRACHLVTDPAGDSGVMQAGSSTVAPDAETDVVSADVAAAETAVTAVVRTAAGGGTTVWGKMYEVRFHTGGSEFALAGLVAADGTNGWVNRIDSQGAVSAIGRATVRVDDARHEVRIEASAGMFKQHVPFRRGTRLGPFTVLTYRVIGIAGSFTAPNGMVHLAVPFWWDGRDVATSNAVYAVGAPSCAGR